MNTQSSISACRRAHIASVFIKLEVMPAADDYGRVLAVLTYLRAG